MEFKKLASYLEKLEKTASRIEMTKILADLFKKSTNDEADKIAYLILGRLAPGYSGVVFNIADKMMIRAISDAFSVENSEIKEVYKDKGDLGEVAFLFGQKSNIKDESYTVKEIYANLLKMAKDEGIGSQERKIRAVSKILSSIDPLSAKYIARVTLGKLRLGFSDKTILDALSWMETGGKGDKGKLEEAYNILPDVGLLAKAVKESGIESTVTKMAPKIGVPMLPMLAQRLKSPKEMVEKMGKVFVEPKFDGLRIQIHYKKSGFENGTKFKAFTRNLNENSWMFPELETTEKIISCKEVIFDSEAIGVDEKMKSMANFQTTMTRRRKYDIENVAKKISIKFFVFDIMYKDGKSLIREPYHKRRELLSKSIKRGGILEVVDYEVTESPGRINELMNQKLKGGMEGIIVKKADSNYVAGRTGWRWVKMKEDEKAVGKLSDTIDCVVMGYTRGKGKRAGFGIGQFLVGVIDGGKIKTVTKVGTGLSDEQFRELSKRLEKIKVNERPKEFLVHKDYEPDYWVNPSLIVEIAGDELSTSPKHTSGLAIRFPRLVRFRDDKNLESATSLGEVKKICKLQ